MSKSIILELHYLPSIQYFSKLFAFKEVQIEQHEHYLKGSYRNRCHIAGVNGILRLTIPLKKGKNEKQPIREVQIAYHEDWQRQHWVSICSAYGNAPFFDFYADGLKPFYHKPYTYLFNFNLALLHWLYDILSPTATLTFSNKYEKNHPDYMVDLRNVISPKSQRQKPDPFFKKISYSQVFTEKNGFLANLSILDLLFCTGPQTGLILEEMLVSM